VKGEIILEIMTDFPERLRAGLVLSAGDAHTPLTLRSVRPHNAFLLVSFEGYDDIDQSAELVNQMVFIPAESLPKLPAGEYYHHQLLGLNVVDEHGKPVGRLSEILETGANDVYVVVQPEGGEILIPAIESTIRGVDLERREMTVVLMDWA
jgi:16S rRNA processing protein RimM